MKPRVNTTHVSHYILATQISQCVELTVMPTTVSCVCFHTFCVTQRWSTALDMSDPGGYKVL